MAIINQKDKSKLGLIANRLEARKFGYFAGTATDKLHNQYSIHTNPEVKLLNFNGSPKVRPESTLDELDLKAPKNLQAGKDGSVVSKIYKSSKGNNYKDLGPTDGRY
jgi:hypothetical protein